MYPFLLLRNVSLILAESLASNSLLYDQEIYLFTPRRIS